MDPFRKWMSRAIIILVVLNLTSLYANWRLVDYLSEARKPVNKEVTCAADHALQSQ